MKAKVAVATVQGKSYFFIVNELKRRNIPFISLMPGEPVPVEVRVVVTTQSEKPLVNHKKILVYNSETEPEIVGSEVIKALQGKEAYETLIIGVDPGEAFGVAAIADGAVVETENCFSIKEVLQKISSVLKTVNVSFTMVSVKVGNGVPIYKELIETLDEALPPEVKLEIVGEAGTNHHRHHDKHGRRLRHIFSAIRIAGRQGYPYTRGKTVEQAS
jgi:hypothetical protein